MPFLELLRIIAIAAAGALSFLTLLLFPFQPVEVAVQETRERPVIAEEPPEPRIEEEPKAPEPESEREPEPQTPAPPEKPAISTPVEPEPESASEAPVSFASTNDRVRAAVVNILCVTANGGPLNPISASGVVIDPRGIIITNAHVGQYLLLKDYPSAGSISCTARVGSPAVNRYELDLMYLSSSWIFANAEKIDDPSPTGTGEFDFAFLRVSGATGTNTLPASFIHVSPTYAEPGVGETVLVAGYPAGFLGGITIAKELYMTSTVSAVTKLYTFTENTTDLISLGGSIVAQKGVSGGAVANSNGELLGIAVTASDGEATGERDLRALTIGHIDRTLTQERGTGLASFLASNPAFAAQTFQLTVAPTLTRLLMNALED
jgi:S1-C subfamily serine protease